MPSTQSRIEDRPVQRTVLERPGIAGPRPGAGEGVDRRIGRRLWSLRRISMTGLAVVVAALLVAIGLSTGGGEHLAVDRDHLTIATVQSAPFQEFVAVTGSVLPRTTVYLDVVEGGRVEEVLVQEGSRVEAGQPIVRLSNHELQLRLLAAEAQRTEYLNRLEDLRFRMEQSQLDLRRQLAEMEYQIQRLERSAGRKERLLEEGLLPGQEYEEALDELRYWKRSRELTLEVFQRERERVEEQLGRLNPALARLDANREVLEEMRESLVLRAPVSGRVTALDAEVGALKPAGSRLGQIDVPEDGYRVRAAIDEFYLPRVQVGQEGTTRPVEGRQYRLTVSRVYPEVTDGRFEIDLEFDGDAPVGLRRGQTIQARLELGASEEAVVLERGPFYETSGGNWVFVVEGDRAVRRPVRLGRQNPFYFEVVDGLEVGDRVVVSSYERLSEAEVLRLRG